MNLRESLLQAAREAPLGSSTVDLDRIITAERRAAVRRRFGTGGALLTAAVAAGLVIPVLTGGRDSTAGRLAAVGPPSGTTVRSTATSVGGGPGMVLTAADVTGLLSGQAGTARSGADSGEAGPARGPVYLSFGARAAADPDGDPCAPTTAAGQDPAPTPQDRCARLAVPGTSAWVRRWGYSPQQRPWTTPETVTIEIFIGYGERQRFVFTISNTSPHGTEPAPPGRQVQKFDVSDEELTKLASFLADRAHDLVRDSTDG